MAHTAAGAVAGFAAQGADWPDFRGPTWDGHAAGATAPLRWSEAENVKWKIAVHGRGWSTPVVDGGRAWLTTATETGEELSVLCIDVESGEVLRDFVLFEVAEPEHRNAVNSYASPSPVLDADRVYVHFGTVGTACLDARTGETLWLRRDLQCDHMEGPGSSPFLVDDLLVLNIDGGDVQYVVALAASTGETVWRRERSVDLGDFLPDMRKAYSTPIAITIDGEDQLVSTGAQATFGYEPRTGKELWTVRHPGFSMASRPVFAADTLYLNTGFMRAQLWAVRPDGEGVFSGEHVLWKHRRGVPTMSSPLLAGDWIFFVSDGGIASCLDVATGAERWRERLGAEHCASPILAGGRIYFCDREGRTTVVAPSPEYEVLAVNELDEGMMASPVVVDGDFILRTRTSLYRIGAREPE